MRRPASADNIVDASIIIRASSGGVGRDRLCPRGATPATCAVRRFPPSTCGRPDVHRGGSAAAPRRRPHPPHAIGRRQLHALDRLCERAVVDDDVRIPAGAASYRACRTARASARRCTCELASCAPVTWVIGAGRAVRSSSRIATRAQSAPLLNIADKAHYDIMATEGRRSERHRYYRRAAALPWRQVVRGS